MNVEMNNESTSEPRPKRREGVPLRKKKSKPHTGPRSVRESVKYSDEELLVCEAKPFWNSIHPGLIKSVSDEGLIATINRHDETLEVFIPREECRAGVDLSPGASIEIYLDDSLASMHSSYPLVGSLCKAEELQLLERAQKAKDANEAVTGYVVSEIKGGYSVALFAQNREEVESGFGLRAFLPLGRASLRRGDSLDEKEHVLMLQISDIDAAMGNIIVSRREILAEGKKRAVLEFFTAHKLGDVVSGKVSAVMPYGVFVDLGSVDGFLHIGDISWDKKPRLKDLVPLGKEISAQIIEIDEEKQRVKLSLKGLNADPWQSIEKTYKPGTEVQGTVVAFADFGAFVKLSDGVEGLVHLGEITWNRIKHPSQFFKIGDQIKAAVLRVDKEARRISLSTKALELSPVERLSGQFPVGTVIKTKVTGIHEFGIFVQMDEESNGLVPRSEISWQRSDEPLENSFSVGQEIEVAVLGYDSNRQRVSCSIKRLKDDPWVNWKSKFRKGSVHKVKVIQVSRAGVTCQLDEELTGFCPRNQLIDESSETGRANVKVGDILEVIVTACDVMHQRVSISQRAQAESETKQAYESYLSEQSRGGTRTTLGDAFKKMELNKGKK